MSEAASLPPVKAKKYRRKKRGQGAARAKKKLVTPRWEKNFRSPASRFLPEDNDVLRTINQAKKDDPVGLAKKVPIGRGLTHLEAVEIMLATMKHRVQEYERSEQREEADEGEEVKGEKGEESGVLQGSEHGNGSGNEGGERKQRQARRGSSAYANVLALHKVVADIEMTKHKDEQNKEKDIGENDPLYTSGLTWSEMTERRQRERKYHEVFPSAKSKLSVDPGLSEADGLRGWVSVIERPDFQWTLEGQREGRKTHLQEKTKLPFILSKTLHWMKSENSFEKAKNKRTALEKIKRDRLNVARASFQLVSKWACLRATYRMLLPQFAEAFKKPPPDNSLFHVGDLVLVHQKAMNIWLTGSVVKINGFDPDADPDEIELHAHHEKSHEDNVKDHSEPGVEGEEEHKRLRTEEVDSDSDEEGRGHGQNRTAHEKDDEEHQAKVLVRFKDRDRTKDQDCWIDCGVGRLRRQARMDPTLCDNLHRDAPNLRPRRVGGLPRVGDKVVVAAVDHHCEEMYANLGLLPVGTCVGQRHFTDSCKVHVHYAALNKSWTAWYNNADTQVVTSDWFDAIAEEWTRLSSHVPRKKKIEEEEEEEEQAEVFRM